jgi:exodeoxyribonuclease VII small subunit
VVLEETTFEAAFAELQHIVRELESGELALDETMALYERGQNLARRCQECLDQAELRIAQLASNAAESE